MTHAIKDAALGDFAHEIETTRAVLARLPGAELAWKPHPKSMSLGELAAHLTNLLHWCALTVEGDGYDLARPIPPPSLRPAFRSCWRASTNESPRPRRLWPAPTTRRSRSPGG